MVKKHIFATAILAILSAFFSFAFAKVTDPRFNTYQLLRYLRRYGYMVEPESLQLLTSKEVDDEIQRAVYQLQSFVGLSYSGALDNATYQVVKTYRCGDPDFVDGSEDSNFLLKGTRWLQHELTWRVVRFPRWAENCGGENRINADVERALSLWESAAALHFTPAPPEATHAHIEFAWMPTESSAFLAPPSVVSGRFAGRLGRVVLAEDVRAEGVERIHAGDGQAENVADTTWVCSGPGLAAALTHVVGHVLGLGHSADPNSAMSPFLGQRSAIPRIALAVEDVKALQELYGGRQQKHDSLCSSLHRMDAAFTGRDGALYVLRWNLYFRLNGHGVLSGFPRKINETWFALPGGIDAAISSPGGSIFFFKGSEYWRYSGSKVEPGYPRPISRGFPGLPNNLDAALILGSSYRSYFFKGALYWLYDSSQRPPIPGGYPRPISHWRGLPDHLSAAVSYRDRIYFFKDDLYYLYDENEGKVADGFPRPIGPDWFNC